MLIADGGLLALALVLIGVLLSLKPKLILEAARLKKRNAELTAAFGRIHAEVCDKTDVNPVAGVVMGEITSVFGEYPRFPRSKEIE